MSNTKKRKRHLDHSNKGSHRYGGEGDDRYYTPRQHGSAQDPTLLIQAHEADLRRGPQAQQLAKSLEVVEYLDSPADSGFKVKQAIGSALIRWTGGSVLAHKPFDGDEEDTISLGVHNVSSSQHTTRDESGIWVDRYDARLLLDALPDFDSPSGSALAHPIPNSPSGWSDLPSDTEETFFFSPEEANDFKNEKRRRLLEQAHEERVKARLEEEKAAQAQEAVDDDPWGGSDEEPDDTQKELMRRTATHLLSSPNPAQLEMRILANHGADKRFAFLKGRWSRSWRLVKAKLRVERGGHERKEKEEKVKEGLGMLTGYDSDSSSEGRDPHREVIGDQPDKPEGQDDEAKKEIRRQKAKEWTEKRRLGVTESKADGDT